LQVEIDSRMHISISARAKRPRIRKLKAHEISAATWKSRQLLLFAADADAE